MRCVSDLTHSSEFQHKPSVGGKLLAQHTMTFPQDFRIPGKAVAQGEVPRARIQHGLCHASRRAQCDQRFVLQSALERPLTDGFECSESRCCNPCGAMAPMARNGSSPGVAAGSRSQGAQITPGLLVRLEPPPFVIECALGHEEAGRLLVWRG